MYKCNRGKEHERKYHLQVITLNQIDQKPGKTSRALQYVSEGYVWPQGHFAEQAVDHPRGREGENAVHSGGFQAGETERHSDWGPGAETQGGHGW